MDNRHPSVAVFDRDASAHGGYLYTATERVSSRLATDRSTAAILALGCFTGRTMLDMGCGDGFYTLRFWDRGLPKKLVGVDAAQHPVAVADAKKEGRLIRFAVADAHTLPFPDDSFDIALVQSILHHDNDPADLIREAFRIAPTVLIHEPNGNNFGLKIIERLSSYHREHGEKSYTSSQLDRWLVQAGGQVTRRCFAGFVPMFCPDALAQAMKIVEPLVERLPVINALGCAVYVVVAERLEEHGSA